MRPGCAKLSSERKELNVMRLSIRHVLGMILITIGLIGMPPPIVPPLLGGCDSKGNETLQQWRMAIHGQWKIPCG